LFRELVSGEKTHGRSEIGKEFSPTPTIAPFLAPATFFFLHKNIPTTIAARRITPSAAPRPIAAPFVELGDLALGVEVEEFEVCEFGAEVPVPVAEEVVLVEVERALL
jgi:hypothetical protein